MKIKNTSLAILLGLVSSSASAKDYVITDGDRVIQKGDWQISNKNISPDAPSFTIENVILKGGKQEGSELLTIKSEG